MQNSDLADRYNIAVENAFIVLGDLPEDPEEAWSITRDTILTTAAENIPEPCVALGSRQRPWTSLTRRRKHDLKATMTNEKD